MVLTVTGRSVGRRRPLFADFSVPVPPGSGGGGERWTLRDLIAHIVCHEVAAFRHRQQSRRFLRALSEREIEQGLQTGKVEAGSSELDQPVEEEQATGAALQAFEDGLYLVVLDGEEQRDLDRQIFLREDSKVTFIRLTFLAGA